MAEEKGKDKAETKVDQALLDEDDDFEEFMTEDWKSEDQDEDDKQVWEDNWDDDKVDDDFTSQLRAELQKLGHSVGGVTKS
uniref:26S proteasome complex subunit SEM1 n=1 Tax=Halisarca dujardinii TaxID=2583056 RepID=A0A6B9CZJ6_HALDU|nr:26S proteasome complex subunit SEM1-like protein [Halisarca dujardinii]